MTVSRFSCFENCESHWQRRMNHSQHMGIEGIVIGRRYYVRNGLVRKMRLMQ
jgi:hypothetical protein